MPIRRLQSRHIEFVPHRVQIYLSYSHSKFQVFAMQIMPVTCKISARRVARRGDPYLSRLLEKKRQRVAKLLSRKPTNSLNYNGFSTSPPYDEVSLGWGEFVNSYNESTFFLRLSRRNKEKNTVSFIEFGIDAFQRLVDVEVEVVSLLYSREEAVVYDKELFRMYVKEGGHTSHYLLHFEDDCELVAINAMELVNIVAYQQQIINAYSNWLKKHDTRPIDTLKSDIVNKQAVASVGMVEKWNQQRSSKAVPAIKQESDQSEQQQIKDKCSVNCGWNQNSRTLDSIKVYIAKHQSAMAEMRNQQSSNNAVPVMEQEEDDDGEPRLVIDEEATCE